MFNQAIRRNVRRSVLQSAASPPSRRQVAGLGAAEISPGGSLARSLQQSPTRSSRLRSRGDLRRSSQRSPVRSRSPLGAGEQAGRWTAWSEEEEDDDDEEEHGGDNQRTSSFSLQEEGQLGVPLLEWLEARGLGGAAAPILEP